MVFSIEQTPSISEIEGSASGPETLQAPLQVAAYINKEGDMKSGSLCAQLWRLFVLLQPVEYCSTSIPHPGLVECDCRQAVSSQSGEADRMVYPSVDR